MFNSTLLMVLLVEPGLLSSGDAPVWLCCPRGCAGLTDVCEPVVIKLYESSISARTPLVQ